MAAWVVGPEKNDHRKPHDLTHSLLYTMRNRVSHGHFKADFTMVWKTIASDLPLMRDQVTKLLAG